MTSSELRALLLALPREERAQLAQELLESLDDATDAEADEAWIDELQCRAREVHDGSAPRIDWADARERISARLRARREGPPSR